jgi:nicotinamidase-related amidase
MLAQRDGTVLVVVDIQPNFLKPIEGADRVLQRTQFLLEMAALLQIPVLVTEQYPSRMGGTDERLLPLVVRCAAETFPKMSFSCAGCEDFASRLSALDPEQVVLVGIETHICVTQTAEHLIEQGTAVFVAADAVGARTAEMHAIGLARLGAWGAVLAHSESLAYEWLVTAENEKFRDALAIVKRYAE